LTPIQKLRLGKVMDRHAGDDPECKLWAAVLVKAAEDLSRKVLRGPATKRTLLVRSERRRRKKRVKLFFADPHFVTLCSAAGLEPSFVKSMMRRVGVAV